MASIRVKVGASLDASLNTVFRKFAEAAKLAARQVATETAGAQASSVREVSDAQQAMTRASRSQAGQRVQIVRNEARQKDRELAQLARQADKWQRDETKSAEREAMARAKATAKATADDGASRKAGLMAAYRVTRTALSFGARAATDILSGAGVNLDYGSHAKNAGDLQQTAVRLTNAGYMPGQAGANGQRQDPQEVMREMQAIANATAQSSNTAIEGLDKFVSKTGDLQSGRNVMMSLARLSKATGADLSEMADAAGDVSNALGDVPNKGQAIYSVMKAIAAQGKEGAVEIKDLASQMAKLGAAAGQYGGDRERNIELMGTLTQMTRAKGGAASATQAATSVMSFTNTFSKGARLDKFQKYGVAVHDKNGMLRDPKDIILDALKATKGDSRKMGEMFADAGARRVTRGFETTYNQAGGGDAGIAAADAAFTKLAESAMNEREIADSLAAAMATTESQAQLLNNSLDEVVGQLQKELVPALLELAPAVLSAAKAAAEAAVSLFGTNGREANDPANKDTRDMGKDLNLTERQRYSGVIYQEQIDRNDAEVKKAAADIAKQQAEVEKNKGGPGWAESVGAGIIGTLASGGGFHPISGPENYRTMKSETQEASEAQLAKNRSELMRMQDTMRDIRQQLADGTLRVREMNPTKPPLHRSEGSPQNGTMPTKVAHR